MNKTIIAVVAIAFWCFAGVAAHAQEARDFNRITGPADSPGVARAATRGDLIFDPLTPEASALPGRDVFPVPANLRDNERARRYTGIIKNKTGYEVSVPSENSDATLTIPPHSWIEYTMWTRRANVTVYQDGKPFYCLKLLADPREYAFMCDKYDFMAEIVKPEPAPSKYKPMKKRKYRPKKRPQA